MKYLMALLSIAVSLFGQNPVMRYLSCTAASASGTTYTCSMPATPAGLVSGSMYSFRSDVANTGAATINFNAWGAKTIKKVAGGVTTDLVANDIQAGQWVYLIYDGTNMQMLSQLGNAASGSTNTRMTIDLPVGGVQGGNVSAGQWNLGGTGANNGYLGSTIPYSNTGGNPSFPATFRFPYNFDKTQSLNVILSGGNTNGVTGTVRFSITLGCSTGGTSSIIAYPSVGTASTITLTVTSNTMAEGTATGLNIPSACDSNKMAQLFVARDNTVSGNLADVFGVIDVALTYGTK